MNIDARFLYGDLMEWARRPNDMYTILLWLIRHGELGTSPRQIEKFWEKYSKLNDSEWLQPKRRTIKKFAIWLTSQENGSET